MRIAIDARFYSLSTGGIGRYTQALLKELAKIDQQNQYTVFVTKKDGREFRPPAPNFRSYQVDFIHYTIGEQIKFWRILEQEKFDLAHFSAFNHPILYNRRFITTIHDLTMMLYPFGRQKNFLKQWAFKKVLQHAVKKSAKIIAVSQATKNDLLRYLQADPTRIKVIYEGIDHDYRWVISNFQSFGKLRTGFPISKQISNSKFQILKKYDITKPYILFVSQWRPHKGLPELVKAFEILKEKYQLSHKLVLIGKPNHDFPEVIKAVEQSKFSEEIIRPGFVEEKDLPALYQQAEVFVFPSHYEGFGLPPLEAMASGVPVVSSNASCMPEILGEAAIYFDPKNSADMAEKINNILINDRRQTIIKKGFEQVKKYSWSKMARQTLGVYREILSA